MFYFILSSSSFLYLFLTISYYYPSFFPNLSLSFTNLSLSLEELALNTAYNLIHIYSRIQILSNKITVFISPVSLYLQNFIKDNLKLFNLKLFNLNYLTKEVKEPNEILNFIYNGKEIFHCLKEEIDEKTKSKLFPEKFDFIIYDNKDEKEVIHKKIIHHYPLELDDYHIENTDYAFMLAELTLHDSIIKIDLQNYYLVNNKINASFLYYLFTKYFSTNNSNSIDFKDFLENYSLKIIDDSVNIKEMYYLDELLLNKTNYQVTQIFYNTFENKITDSFINPPSQEN